MLSREINDDRPSWTDSSTFLHGFVDDSSVARLAVNLEIFNIEYVQKLLLSLTYVTSSI